MDIEILKQFTRNLGTPGVSVADNAVWEDQISGKRFYTQQECWESVADSFRQSGGNPNQRLSDLKNLYIANS